MRPSATRNPGPRPGTARTWRVLAPLAAVLATALATPPSMAQAGHRHLSPMVATEIRGRLEALGPDWTVGDVRVSSGSVQVQLLPREGRDAVTLRIVPAAGGCDGTTAGEWCLPAANDPLPEGLAARLQEALAVPVPELPHGTVAGTPAPPGPPAWRASAGQWTWAAGLVALPLLAGFLGGRAARRGLARAGRGTRIALMVPAALLPLASLAIVPFGLWDLVMLALCWTGGFACGAACPAARRLTPAALCVLLTLVLLEGLARYALPAAPATQPAPGSPILQPGTAGRMQEEACALLDPDAHPDVLASRFAGVAPDERVVVHLGDSMIYPLGVAPGETLPALLDRSSTGTRHVSAAAMRTGPAFHLKVLRRCLQLVKPALVVLHLCLTNDWDDRYATWECCDGGTLLDVDAEGRVVDRCPAPVPVDSAGLQHRLRNSPAAFPLRVAGTFSVLARHLQGLLARWSDRGLSPAPGDDLHQWNTAVLKAIRDELATRRIPLVVVLAPHRPDFSAAAAGGDATGGTRPSYQAILHDLGIPFLDAREPFSQAARYGLVDRMFLPWGPDEIHLGAEGHRLEADWLRDLLKAFLARPPADVGTAPAP
mgnify:CR=1 FL=1